MLNPYYGLFQYSRDDIYTLQINPDSAVNPVGELTLLLLLIHLCRGQQQEVCGHTCTCSWRRYLLGLCQRFPRQVQFHSCVNSYFSRNVRLS